MGGGSADEGEGGRRRVERGVTVVARWKKEKRKKGEGGGWKRGRCGGRWWLVLADEWWCRPKAQFPMYLLSFLQIVCSDF